MHIFPSHIGTMVDHFNFLIIIFFVIINIIISIIILFKMNYLLCVKNYIKCNTLDTHMRNKNHFYFAIIESLSNLFKIKQMVNSETDILHPVLTDLLQCTPQEFPFTHFLPYGPDRSIKPIYNLSYCSYCLSLLFFLF